MIHGYEKLHDDDNGTQDTCLFTNFALDFLML
jgi:hypothetical protein